MRLSLLQYAPGGTAQCANLISKFTSRKSTMDALTDWLQQPDRPVAAASLWKTN